MLSTREWTQQRRGTGGPDGEGEEASQTLERHQTEDLFSKNCKHGAERAQHLPGNTPLRAIQARHACVKHVSRAPEGAQNKEHTRPRHNKVGLLSTKVVLMRKETILPDLQRSQGDSEDALTILTVGNVGGEGKVKQHTTSEPTL